MNRIGEPKDLLGTMLWLLAPAPAFDAGIVVLVTAAFRPSLDCKETMGAE